MLKEVKILLCINQIKSDKLFDRFKFINKLM